MGLFADSQIDGLCEKVCSLLVQAGMKVVCDEMTRLLVAKGCTIAPDGRARIPKELIDEFVDLQKARLAKQRQQARAASTAARKPSQSQALMSCAFSPGPTRYYDYDRKETVPVDTEIFTQMMKFADATPEIARIHPWFRQDIPQEVGGVQNVILGLKLTKRVTGIDAINPKEVKYLVEIGEIVTGRPGDTTYLAGSQCMTPPLILGHRAAQEMLERARCGVKKYYVATMTMVGATAPVDIASAAVLATAEVLGGLITAYVVNPEAVFTGTAATTVLDMASGNNAMNAPESALLDGAVKELFDQRFGGHVSAHVRYAPNAKVPGLQAVYENFFGALASAMLLCSTPAYAGNGNLDIGGVGSPVQAMLDIEVMKSLAKLKDGISLCSEPISFEGLCETIRCGGDFLSSEHTLKHFRSVWSPQLFLRRQLGHDWDGSEKAILDRCNAAWKQNLTHYQPPDWDKEVLRALDDLLQRARKEFGV